MSDTPASTCDLQDRHCSACTGATPKLTAAEIEAQLVHVPEWRGSVTQSYGYAIKREFSFKNFAAALAFVNRVGEIAEQEGHHPDIFIHNWKKVTLTLTTHAIGALSINDFIVAAKLDRLASA